MTPRIVKAAVAALALVAAPLAATSLPATAAPHGQPGREFTMLQMNLCLSGVAGCYPGTEYPAVIDEAVDLIKQTKPDAVTVNEACSNDMADLAARTGYRVEFSTVIYGGAPLECSKPTGRGYFGNAILTKVPVRSVEQAPYATQQGKEERRYMCVETVHGVSVCGSHLAVGSSVEAQQAQCQALEGVLADRAAKGPTFFGGDVNRRTDCAPQNMWVTTDAKASQAPGIMHIYGSNDTTLVRSTWLPATYTDHDFLLTTAVVPPKGHRR